MGQPALPHRREAALGKLSLDRRREEKVKQLVRGGALPGVAYDDRALLDGRIKAARDDEVRTVRGKARGEGGSEGDEARVGVGGVDELGGLGDVFCGDEARLEGVIELETLERGDGGAAIGRAIGIGGIGGIGGGIGGIGGVGGVGGGIGGGRDWRWPGASRRASEGDRGRAEEAASLSAPRERACLAHR